MFSIILTFFRRSILAKVSLIVVMTTTATLTGLGLWQYETTRTTLENALQHHATMIADRLAVSFRKIVWDYDEEAAQGLLLAEMEEKSVWGILIGEENGEVLYGAWRTEDGTPVLSSHPLTQGDFITREQVILRQGTAIGQTSVFLSRRYVNEEMRQALWNITSLVILLDGVLVLVLTILIRLFLIGPLAKLRNAMGRIQDGELNQEVEVTSSDEIGTIAHSFNLMVEQLKEREKELHTLNAELEERVADRTSQLAAAKEHAEKANRAKSVFLANMSHELRTPLNAVLGFSQLMMNDPDVSPRQKENLDIITRSGGHLLNLIDNVLEISKIESGRIELEEAPVSLNQLMQEIKSMMYARAHEKGLDFTLKQSPDLPGRVVTDGGKLRQILINLIGNAVKYTTTGGVILRLRPVAQKASGRMLLRFEVEDTGPGIREEDRKRIFFPFTQLGERPPTEAGAGLGLAICKQYVELMGGQINVAGEPGKGALFYFEIPTEVTALEERSEAPPLGHVIGVEEGQPRYRLLIAEDQPENRLLLHNLLEPLGFDLREAHNGQEAVTLFEQWHPHLIWMDIRMPVMDGLEATRLIKASAGGAHTRIVALTAHALEEERREILAAGCDDFVRKPYRHIQIFDALRKHLGVRFVYEDESVPADTEEELNAAALADLPVDILKGLEQALVRLDIDAVRHAIEMSHAHDPLLAEALSAAARNLQFGLMLRLIRAACAATDQEENI